jgi:hypothetical protein
MYLPSDCMIINFAMQCKMQHWKSEQSFVYFRWFFPDAAALYAKMKRKDFGFACSWSTVDRVDQI